MTSIARWVCTFIVWEHVRVNLLCFFHQKEKRQLFHQKHTHPRTAEKKCGAARGKVFSLGQLLKFKAKCYIRKFRSFYYFLSFSCRFDFFAVSCVSVSANSSDHLCCIFYVLQSSVNINKKIIYAQKLRYWKICEAVKK